MPYVRYYNDDVYIAEHVQASSLKRKLANLWPKKVVQTSYYNGETFITEDVEVFAEHFYFYSWPRANGTLGVVLEPDEGYWSNGIQYLGAGYDKTKHAKKLYDLVGIKYKPANAINVTKDFDIYNSIFQIFLTYYKTYAMLPSNEFELLSVVTENTDMLLVDMFNTYEYPLANFNTLLTYFSQIDITKLETDMKHLIIRFMEHTLGYIKVTDCIATGTEYIENIKIKRLDRGYFYLNYDSIEEFRDLYLNKINDNTYEYKSLNIDTVLNSVLSKIPLVYPLNRDPFNPDPLLPYPYTDPLNPTKTVWITPELTDFNPDVYKDTEDPTWDKNGWITANINIINIPYNISTSTIIENVMQYPNGLFSPFATTEEPQYSFSVDLDDYSLLAALSDVNGVLFERVFTLKPSWSYTEIGTRVDTLVIKYRRIHTPSTLVGTTIEEAFKKNYWKALQALSVSYTIKPNILPYVNTFAKYTIPAKSVEGTSSGATMLWPLTSLSATTTSCSISAASVVFGDMLNTGATSSIMAPLTEGKTKYTDNGKRLKVNNQLKARVISRSLGSMVNHGYTINERSKLEKFVKIVIEVVLTAVGVVVVTIGYIIGGTPGAVIANFAVQIVYRVAAAVMYNNGMDYYAEAVVNAADNTQLYTTVLLITDIVASGISNIGTAEITNMTIQELVDYAITSIQDFVIEQLTAGATSFTTMTTEQVMMSVINVLNTAFKAYSEYIDPPNKGIKEMEELVKTQNEELASMKIGGDMMNVIQTYLDTPFSNQYDFNEVMHASYNKLTQGKINEVYTRYYNGISPFRYDPYWG